MPIQPGQLTIRQCKWCKAHLTDGRSDKQFCGATCRKRYDRWDDRLKQATHMAMVAVDRLAEAGQFPEKRDLMKLRLTRLSKRIDEKLASLNKA